jgi:DNA replication factor GINS
MVGLDDLRKALLSEREAGKLIPIGPDFFERTHKTLHAIRERVQASEDPFSDDVQKLILETKSIEQTLFDLFTIRVGKIVSLAESQAKGQYIDREEIKRMISPELEMFERISAAISACQRRLVRDREQATLPLEPEVPPHEAPERSPVPAGESFPARPAPVSPAPAYALVRVLADMDAFMGVDGKTYDLERGDIVTLPERNAEVLVERNIALNMNLSK